MYNTMRLKGKQMSNREDILSQLMAKRTMDVETETAVSVRETIKPFTPSIDRKVIVQLVNTPRNELFSATQLWKLMGSKNNLRPQFYLKLEATQRFIESEYPQNDVSADNRCVPVKKQEFLLLDNESICKTYRGRNAGTYMEKKLLLDYAQWLSPEIKSMVLETFIEYGQIEMEKDPNKKAKMLIERGFDVAVGLKTKAEADQISDEEKFERLKRAASIATRKAFTSAIEIASGVRMQDSPELCSFVARITNRLYMKFLGDDANTLKKGLGLGKHTTPRESLNHNYLSAIHFTEQEIIHYLRTEKDKATPKGVEAIIDEIYAIQKPMLDRIDSREAVATHLRFRKGSGYEKGTYSANRSRGSCLNYSYDNNIKKLGN